MPRNTDIAGGGQIFFHGCPDGALAEAKLDCIEIVGSETKRAFRKCSSRLKSPPSLPNGLSIPLPVVLAFLGARRDLDNGRNAVGTESKKSDTRCLFVNCELIFRDRKKRK
jgi:hypothetical protein